MIRNMPSGRARAACSWRPCQSRGNGWPIRRQPPVAEAALQGPGHRAPRWQPTVPRQPADAKTTRQPVAPDSDNDGFNVSYYPRRPGEHGRMTRDRRRSGNGETDLRKPTDHVEAGPLDRFVSAGVLPADDGDRGRPLTGRTNGPHGSLGRAVHLPPSHAMVRPPLDRFRKNSSSRPWAAPCSIILRTLRCIPRRTSRAYPARRSTAAPCAYCRCPDDSSETGIGAWHARVWHPLAMHAHLNDVDKHRYIDAAFAAACSIRVRVVELHLGSLPCHTSRQVVRSQRRRNEPSWSQPSRSQMTARVRPGKARVTSPSARASWISFTTSWTNSTFPKISGRRLFARLSETIFCICSSVTRGRMFSCCFLKALQAVPTMNERAAAWSSGAAK